MRTPDGNGPPGKEDAVKVGKLIAWVLLFVCPAAVSAEEPDAAQPRPPRESSLSVVVTAARTEQSLRQVPTNTSLLDAEDVEQSACQSVDDLLRQVPGFNLLAQGASTVSSPSRQTVSMRGLGGGTSASRALVLVDGIPIHDPFGGNVYWARVPRERIERIEVVRGGGSSVWGNLALGGVINVITKPARPRGLDLSVAAGHPGTSEANLSASHVAGPLSFTASGSYYDTEGYYVAAREIRGPIDKRANKQFETLSGKVRYEASDDVGLYLGAGWFTEDQNRGTPLTDGSTDIRSLSGGATVDARGAGAWEFNLFSDFQDFWTDSSSVASARDSERPTRYREFDASTLGANAIWSRTVGEGGLLMAGTDFQRLEIDVNESTAYSSTLGEFTLNTKTDGEQQLAGVFVQGIATPSPKWQVVATGRFDRVVNEGAALETDIQSGATVRDRTFGEHSEDTFNPSVGARFHVTGRASLRGSAYGGFRAPTMTELYRGFSGRGAITEGNPNLAPERLQGAEIGGDFELSDRVILRATVFHNIVEDLVQNVTIGEAGDADEVIEPCGLVPANTVCRERQNVGEMESSGVELELEFLPHPRWRLFGSYFYNRTDVTDAPQQPQLVGKEARHAPAHQLVLRLRRDDPSLFDTSIQGRYVGERFEDDLNTLEVDELLVVDLMLSRSISPSTELFLAVQNLFDEEYEVRVTASGYVEVGTERIARFGLRFTR